MLAFRGSVPGHSVEPTSKTWSVACLLYCLRAQFGRVTPNPIRFSNRQWPKQYPVDNAENRGVRPDAQREGEHGDSGEAGILQQLAKGEFEITHNATPPSDRLALPVAPAPSRQAGPLPSAPPRRSQMLTDR